MMIGIKSYLKTGVDMLRCLGRSFQTIACQFPGDEIVDHKILIVNDFANNGSLRRA